MQEKSEFTIRLPFGSRRTVLKLQGDRVIWMIVFFLSIMSTLAVYSSISVLGFRHGSTFMILLKHVFMLVIGLGVMYYIHRKPFKVFSRLSMILIWAAAFLLLYTLLFGNSINSAERWIKIPFTNVTFQTSDFAKIVLVTYVARMLTFRRDQLQDFRRGVVPILIPVGIICGLILPANFSTAFLLGVVCLILMYVGGVPWKHLAKIFLAGLAGVLLIITIGEWKPDLLPRYSTWKNRIFNSMDDESEGNFQSNLAKVAIYNGGIIPNGPGTGTSRNYLPHPYSDMIYAFIIEEYGSVVGGLGMVLLYLILLFRSVRIVSKCQKHFGALLTLGLSLQLVLQALTNMSVAVGLIPTTGQPLPLVSMGGTSTIFTCLAIGMILSVSRSIYNPEEMESAEDVSESMNNRPLTVAT